MNPETKQLRQDDLDFARNARESILQHRFRGLSLILICILATIATFVYWASQAEIDEVTKGEGKIIPPSSIQTISNLEGGILAEVMVREGQRVSAGEPLVRLDDTQRKASYREGITRMEALNASLIRLNAESTGATEIPWEVEFREKRPELVEREQTLFTKRLTELAQRKQTILQSLNIAREEEKMTAPLVERQVVSRLDLLRIQREIQGLEGEMAELEQAFRREAAEKYNEIKAEYESLQETVSAIEDTLTRTLVNSPVEGTVNKIHITTQGGVIQPGEPILDIVPVDGTLLVSAKIRPGDIAFLRPGQPAVVKLTAYDFAIYGGLDGVVEHISADTIQDEIDQQHYYEIKVRNTSGQLMHQGKELSIIPGMVAEVDVLTGRRTVLQYLLKPIHRMRANSLSER